MRDTFDAILVDKNKYGPEDMIGVVLWSDPQECKAVIWCEDHGDLAFYNDAGAMPCKAPDLDAGDLVEFDVETSKQLRLAYNPRLLQEGACSNLSDVLNSQTAVASQELFAPSRAANTAEVIPFTKPVQHHHSPQVASKTG